MEALSRLRDTERGHISPVDFVEVAESKGLIEQLGDVAFEKVCKFICDNKDVVNAVSINFSVNQIAAPNVVKKIMNTIERFNLAPSNIIIELTESVFIENFEPIFKNITELSQKGVKFYLDDFGTGYSNLANVIALPFSTVKMDRSLVLMMEESSRNVNLVSNLISTFKGANLQILVEGVETEVQNNLVKSAGADFIQGFLYSRPLPANECLELLRK
jgi:EAL domain-containing protein (putative c-di-GMP-specific phosphodiesterase class I)